MTEQSKRPGRFEELRQRAEAIVKRQGKSDVPVDSEEFLHLLHEIEVYQVEIELQNEELNRNSLELQRSRDDYYDLFDSAPVGFVITDAKGRIEQVNAAAAAVLGDDPAWQRGRFLMEWIYPPDRSGYFAWFQRMANIGNVDTSIDLRLSGESGEIRHVRFDAKAIWEETSRLKEWRIALTDITERKRAEEKLRESEEKFRSVFEQAAIGICRVNFGDARWIEVNDTFCRMVGYSPEELQRTPWPQMTHPDDIDLDLIPFRKMAAGKLENYSVEKRFIHKKGHHVWARLTLSLVRDAEGRPDYEIAIIEDITQRKEAEEAVRISEEKFSKAFHVSPTFLFISELSTGMFIEVNDACCTLSGWERDELLGHTSLERNIFSPPGREKMVNHLRSAGRVEMIELDFITKTGMVKTCLLSAEVIDYMGKKCIVCSGVDLTERKRAEERLEAANKELEAFSYSVSHDLRTPLLAISRLSSLLRRNAEELDARATEYLKRIEEATQKMNALIGDLMRLSRISRQEMTKEEIDLSTMVKALVDELAQQRPQRQVRTVIADDLQTRGDAQLLRIALTNLLENAWKYTGKTKDARIEFGLCRKNSRDVFFLCDNGVGFPMERADRLFKPFQRLHGESEFFGTGIGLPIVFRIISRHGGEIWGEGEPGKGAVFYFTLES